MFDPIKELISIIIKKKSLFGKIFSFLILLSLSYIFFIRTPYYTSNAKIFINSKTTSLNQTSFLGGILGPQTSGARDVQILTEIIKGNTFFDSLLSNNQIIDTENDRNLKSILENKINNDNKQKMHQEFMEILQLSYDSKKQIIDIGLTSENRQIAKNSTSLLLEQIEKSYINYKNGLEINKILSLEDRIFDVNEKLLLIEKKLTSFRENNINFESSPSLLIQYEGIVRNRLIMEQTIITLNSQKELSELELKSNADLFLVINAPYLPVYKDLPTNKMLFLVLVICSLFISITYVIIINEKLKGIQ